MLRACNGAKEMQELINNWGTDSIYKVASWATTLCNIFLRNNKVAFQKKSVLKRLIKEYLWALWAKTQLRGMNWTFCTKSFNILYLTHFTHNLEIMYLAYTLTSFWLLYWYFWALLNCLVQLTIILKIHLKCR